VVVSCWKNEILNEKICNSIFSEDSKTTKKSKRSSFHGKSYRLVAYPMTEAHGQVENRHLGDMDLSLERLVLTIPNHVQGVAPHSSAIDQVMVEAVNSKRMVAFLVDSEGESSSAYRALSYSFKRYVKMGYVSTTDSSILDRFQIKTLPALVVMFEQPDVEKKEEEEELIDSPKKKEKNPQRNVQFGMAQYDIETMGPIQYGKNIFFSLLRFTLS
jgi:hypothetical protein